MARGDPEHADAGAADDVRRAAQATAHAARRAGGRTAPAVAIPPLPTHRGTEAADAATFPSRPRARRAVGQLCASPTAGAGDIRFQSPYRRPHLRVRRVSRRLIWAVRVAPRRDVVHDPRAVDGKAIGI